MRPLQSKAGVQGQTCKSRRVKQACKAAAASSDAFASVLGGSTRSSGGGGRGGGYPLAEEGLEREHPLAFASVLGGSTRSLDDMLEPSVC